MGLVYMIKNLVNGKQYVGQTSRSLNERWNSHVCCDDSSMPISHAIKKYGRESFDISVLEECDNELLNEKEMLWIKKLDTFKGIGYNATAGGGGIRGYTHTEDAKKRMSKNRSGELNCNYCKKFGMWGPNGKGLTEELRANLSIKNSGKNNGMYGVKHTEDARKKISKGLIDRNNVKVDQYSKDDQFIMTHNSMKYAAASCNGHPQKISEVCRNIRRSHKGYIWRYNEKA